MQLITEAPIKSNTKVLVRCDLDIPLNNGKPENTFRLDSNLQTLKHILDNNAHPVIVGKIGSPNGIENADLSTAHLKPYFDEHLGKDNYTLLENTRFNPGEKEGSVDFAQQLASKAQIYVNECFSTSHRKDASIYEITKLLPSYAGFHLQKEIENLSKLLNNPQRPFVVIVGGAKVESKLPTVYKFIKQANYVLLGGLIGVNWQGEKTQNLYLPVDYMPGNKDIGPRTLQQYKSLLLKAKTVLWAGPLGEYENEQFAKGTKEIAQQIADSSAFSIVGGGDTIQATQKFGLLEKFSFVSTGGGAMLEFLVKGNLPGLEVLGYKPAEALKESNANSAGSRPEMSASTVILPV